MGCGDRSMRGVTSVDGCMNGIQLRGAGHIGHVCHHSHPLNVDTGAWGAGRTLGSLVVVPLVVMAAELVDGAVGGLPRGFGGGGGAPGGCTHGKHLDSQTVNNRRLVT